jgi:hypothetical protein
VAEYAGDEAFADASASRAVTVAVITTTRLSGYYGTSGGYRLYHAGQDPLQVGKVVPNHAGKGLRFPVQARVNGHWLLLGSPRFKIGPNGSVGVRWINPTSGFAYRVRNVFEGDADHVGDISTWKYFKVT